LILDETSAIPEAVAGGAAISKPRRLRPGDAVGVIAPAGSVDEERLRDGLTALEAFGLRPRIGRSVLARRGYLAGSDAGRLADVVTMLGDPEIRAVLCARGGYGSQRIVPAIDFSVLRADPKPVVGYSDVTAVLNAAVAAGVGAFHGPMVATDLARGLTPRSADSFLAALFDPAVRMVAEVPTAIRPGRGRGRLVGGCLSIVVTLLGTQWAIDTAGAILFLEDIAEWPYRLDRMLLQLRQAGAFERVAGVVFGTMATCRGSHGLAPIDVIRAAFADAPYPVGFGLPAGHVPAEADAENLTLPLGTMVELDVEAGTLVALEPAVV
jgi:muramoyltetrapeptide carboxypeptidase